MRRPGKELEWLLPWLVLASAAVVTTIAWMAWS